MTRRGTVALAALLVLPAAPPSPSRSTVPNVICCPAGDWPYRVTIRDAAGLPVPNANVWIVFTEAGGEALCWSSGQGQTVVTGKANTQGEATFFLRAGGCADPAVLGTVCQIYANNVNMGARGVVSPDAVAPFCEVGLSDVTYHTPAFKGYGASFCSDFNGDGRVTLGDVTMFTSHMGHR